MSLTSANAIMMAPKLHALHSKQKILKANFTCCYQWDNVCQILKNILEFGKVILEKTVDFFFPGMVYIGGFSHLALTETR